MADTVDQTPDEPLGTHDAEKKSVYRASGAIFGVAVSGAGFLGLFALALLGNGGGRPVAAVFAIVLLWLTIRMIGLGVHVSDGGIKVVNYVRSTQIAWADVAGFDVRRYSSWRFVGHVVRQSGGRAIPILAIAGQGRERVQQPIDELTQLLGRQRPAADDASE
jgi:Bacterial PH domain